ncbi:hypothetical protein SAMN05216419_104223 [Nitrosomonas cryotolerans]|uniref:Uncharacterized protein n=1 Tax=Nitrosomonas cryotolerans ATCC 49181 TaxID=1131553 RepID=A0A1N6F7I9_9PROT|nr:hypothetical protein SAMN05216419_104223 [Nitrosomonas cryotolerans]SIN91227.1 hypothetical protein SAMN02743940_0127 [Nitrosomonas cryotolerans ATCC 49181]
MMIAAGNKRVYEQNKREVFDGMRVYYCFYINASRHFHWKLIRDSVQSAKKLYNDTAFLQSSIFTHSRRSLRCRNQFSEVIFGKTSRHSILTL